MIRIKSKQEGFRRCGVAHSKNAVEYADDRFSEDELAILQGESMLVVEVLPYSNQPPQAARAIIAQVKVTEDMAELDRLAAENQDRKSVLDAIEKRRKDLEA